MNATVPCSQRLRRGACGALATAATIIALTPGLSHAQQVGTTGSDASLQEQLREQGRMIRELQQALAEQQRKLDAVVNDAQPAQAIAGQPTGPGGSDGVVRLEAAPAAPAVTQPVGQAPEELSRPPEVAQIFDQPGVLTPRRHLVVEPSLQFGYSANDRVALVGYTVIPALLIGLIDVRQVKAIGLTGALTARYGVSNRFELEARVPYVWNSTDTVSREILTGSAQDKVFKADGRGLGDIEVSARYQLNRGGADKPYYIAWLRYKSASGRDPFEVTTDCLTRCVGNTTGTGLPLQLPTGSGFQALQPGLTWLYPSDPVVFFGGVSWLHNFKRSNVSRTVLSGAPEGYPQTTREPIGEVAAGDIFGFNIGAGLALNEKAAISLGYDMSVVGKLQQNGKDAPGAVRTILGTLIVGGTYRISERTSLNVSLGVGVTRDTPDASLTVRVPTTF